MALTPGTPAPAFTAKDTSGNTVSLADYAGKTVVLYFYPKDDTPGCSMEASSFRDNYSAYQEKDIVVFGVSGDDQASHQKFAEKFELPFSLLADSDKTMINAYDVDGGGYAQRVTYVINPQGNIDKVYTSVNASTHAADVLADLGL